MPDAQLVATIKDVVLAASAVVGAVVAVRGLNTWNRQLQGGAEYELARRVLKLTYRLRDVIKAVRHPVMWAAEMPSPSEADAATMSRDEVRHYGTAMAYQARWQKVADVRTELQTELLEAEVLWGSELRKRFEALNKLEHELLIAVRSFLDVSDPRTHEARKQAVFKRQQGARDVMYDDLSDKGDEFTQDVVRAIQPIEDYVKPHLRK
jgi:hypothetical protein